MIMGREVTFLCFFVLGLVIACPSNPGTADQSKCGEGRFLCSSDQKCIGKTWVCDGTPDCKDGSDETTPECKGGTAELGLAKHNEYRANHGAAPLTIDNDLCTLAQGYADKLASEDPMGTNGVMEHNPNRGDTGENIYATTEDCSADAAVASWYSEVDNYDWKNRLTPLKGMTGHFTQVVWRESSTFCMAFAKGASGWCYLVANYAPSGNLNTVEAHEYNVLPAGTAYDPGNTTTPKPEWVKKCDMYKNFVLSQPVADQPNWCQTLTEKYVDGNVCSYCE